MELLLEIGCEEIPAKLIGPALRELAEAAERALKEDGLADEGFSVRPLGTPRRLALLMGPVRERQPDRSEILLGPRWEAAFDREGRPTAAAVGFARGKGIDPGQLVPMQGPRGKVAGLERKVPGRPAAQVLPDCLQRVLSGLRFPKSMRWAEGEHSFIRPVHWLCALLGDRVLPLEFAGARSDRFSRGHRFMAPEPFALSEASAYLDELERRQVVADPVERRRLVAEQAGRLAEEVGGRLVSDAELLEEVSFLLEQPVAVLGRFEDRFLRLPREVLIAAMRNHQRYFAIEEAEGGKLLGAFVALANTPARDMAVVRRGFERVLVARLRDAEFFFEVDRKKSLEERVPALDEVVFQAELGSYGEKTLRLERLAEGLLDLLQIRESELRRQVKETSRLCKTDLLTEMVKEFPELAGIMGGVYAELEGKEAAVARGIREHVQPRGAFDQPPQGAAGAIVALADRLDTLAGCFGVGLRPTGVSDPFALRRQCLGALAIVLDKGWHISLRAALQLAVAGVRDKVAQAKQRRAEAKQKKKAAHKGEAPPQIQAQPFEQELLEELTEFFAGRLRQRFLESECQRPDVVEAVLAVGWDDVVDARERVRALRDFFQQASFENLAVAFKRVANILGDFGGGGVEESLLCQPEEKELWQVARELEPQFRRALDQRQYHLALGLLAERLRAPVDRFFDKVLVNDPQRPDLQRNRLALLKGIESLFGAIADFSRTQLKI